MVKILNTPLFLTLLIIPTSSIADANQSYSNFEKCIKEARDHITSNNNMSSMKTFEAEYWAELKCSNQYHKDLLEENSKVIQLPHNSITIPNQNTYQHKEIDSAKEKRPTPDSIPLEFNGMRYYYVPL